MRPPPPPTGRPKVARATFFFFPGLEEAGDGHRPSTLPLTTHTLDRHLSPFLLALQTGNRLSHNNTQERPVAEVTGSRLLRQPAALSLRTGAARAAPPDAWDRRFLRADSAGCCRPPFSRRVPAALSLPGYKIALEPWLAAGQRA